ncbi:hypothetical protein [Methanothrix sp.]|jgi:hypothetical protein|uniref:hypothetical protein n=1 Tax=Methanothrix sp. TaxID=90426 RepID=UPI0027B845F0|nr:hypothetical protein [Euryarchaeota archaeon]
MYELNYDLWQEVIEDIASEYAPLFSIMHEAARELLISRPLIDDLLRTRELEISTEPWQMWLQIDPIDDNIGGFRIYLMASEDLDAIKELMMETAEDRGISQEEINAFEVEHGLDMLGDVFEVIRDRYEILPEIGGDNVTFSLVAFDSQDIDDSKGNDIFWSDDAYTN